MPVLNFFSPVRLFVTLWPVARQAPLSNRFSRQEHWSGLLSPSPGDLPDPGIEPVSSVSPALAGGFFTNGTTWEAQSWYGKSGYLEWVDRQSSPLVGLQWKEWVAVS